MSAYIPYYKRPPNKFIQYVERKFSVEPVLTGIERIAVYKDKNGVEKEETAPVMWDRYK